MHVRRSGSDAAWPSEPDDVARAVLDLLVNRHPELVAVDELLREFCDPWLLQRIDEVLVHDALVDLATSGLVHRLDRFVFPTRAMMRAVQLRA